MYLYIFIYYVILLITIIYEPNLVGMLRFVIDECSFLTAMSRVLYIEVSTLPLLLAFADLSWAFTSISSSTYDLKQQKQWYIPIRYVNRRNFKYSETLLGPFCMWRTNERRIGRPRQAPPRAVNSQPVKWARSPTPMINSNQISRFWLVLIQSRSAKMSGRPLGIG